ncbi:hypothetical protein JRQ81_000665 [Phrynocephalus forsythii]|uniref:Golgi associated RAB2 interactor protein-like Rab2B-binding domain-containing protein n=1 Tax=Phrynocephalus forsythii TaxID=171643 RepID=A0A9Q1B859_9SAUR|nr:hypothetical protein JRQ81_000665 [Phrynocephalus forsythii]
MGDLQKVLDKGEYISLKPAPVFESNFVQVTRRGESIYLHNRPNYVTMGICASSPNLSMPNVMLLAHSTPSSSKADISTRPATTKRSSSDELVLTRFLPLKFVDLSVHSAKKRRIKLKLVSGRAYYLELCARPEKEAHLFHQWTQLINLLNSQSKSSPFNALSKDFATREESRDVRNETLKEYNEVESLILQPPSEEPVKAEIVKKTSSKRVTISDIVGPIEEFRRSHSQATVYSYSCLKKPSTDSENQNEHSQESMKSTVTKNRSREREFFSSTEKRLQTSAISSATVFPLINLSLPLL